jgi:hypothetical protein
MDSNPFFITVTFHRITAAEVFWNKKYNPRQQKATLQNYNCHMKFIPPVEKERQPQSSYFQELA